MSYADMLEHIVRLAMQRMPTFAPVLGLEAAS
jgi:hypothetical protein